MYSSGTTGPPKCMVHSVGVSRKLGHRVTNVTKVQGGSGDMGRGVVWG